MKVTCININHPKFKEIKGKVPETFISSQVSKNENISAAEIYDNYIGYLQRLESNKEKTDIILLKGNEKLYKEYNLLNEKGEIKTVPDNKDTKKWLTTLNESPLYTFVLRDTMKGKKIFITEKIQPKSKQLPLFNESGKEPNRLSQYFTSDKSSSQKILTQISKLDGGLGTIAKKLLENKLDIPIELVEGSSINNSNLPEGMPKFLDDNFSAAGVYYQNKIYIAKQTKFKDSTEGTLLHEILHGYTYHYIKNNPDTSSVKALEELVKYLNQPEISKLLRDKYPISNIDELLVGIFTNPKLIEDLKLLEPKNKNFKSVWDQILQIFKVIFGVSDRTLFDEVFSASAQVLDESMNQMKDIEDASEINLQEVQYGLKSVNILQSDKAKQVFIKGEKAGWDLNKILTELQIPKPQKELILSLGKTKLDDIITDLLANYSYVVEINTAKTKGLTNWRIIPGPGGEEANWAAEWTNNQDGDLELFNTEQEAREFIKNKQTINENTQYYFNLTVPGGTNYTENEISTPAITPSIKGHAQFATDKGIGWFRSDEQKESKQPRYYLQYGNQIPTDANIQYFNTKEEAQKKADEYNKDDEYGIWEVGEEKVFGASKTRRILEVQSDLFQKGRDKKTLSESITGDSFILNNELYEQPNPYKQEYIKSKLDENYQQYDYKELTIHEYLEAKDEFESNNKENQFLQFLNKDNNWQTFFIKSIIQDSAKKGYEKVLFPTGNTASKVEGHSTLEEFKKQQQDRLEGLTDRKNNLKIIEREDKTYKWGLNDDGVVTKYLTKEDAQYEMDSQKESLDREINNVKKELERVEKEGFGALKPIYNFYENTVTNILKKQGYNPVLITDEYGNTWNEVEIKKSRDLDRILANESAENTGKQKLISNKLDDLQRKVIRNPIDNSVKVEGFENIEWIRPSTEAKGDIQRRSFGITTEKQEEFNKLSQDVGTLVHAIQADIIKKNFPEFNKHIPSFTSDTDLSDFYSSLEEQMQPVIDSAKKRGSILKAEVFIGNTKSKKGGTVDLLEITTDGNFIVYDTKTRYSPDKSAKRRLNKIQEWSVQTGIYGDILKTGDNSIGVVSGKFLGAYILEFEFEKLGDYVNMKFNGAPRSTSVEKFLSRRKATMKIVAPTFLRTKNEKINKTIDTLNRQIAELAKQKGGTAEQIMQRDRILFAKIELMQSLQLKMDTQRLIDQAYEDLGLIKTMLDKEDLSDSSFINDQLLFYSTIRSQVEDLDESKVKEIKIIMADANELMERYKEVTIKAVKQTVFTSGIQDALEKAGKSLEDPVQDSGKMFMLLMPTSQVDDPYIAAAISTTNIQLAKAREKTLELFKLVQEKANAYKKATGFTSYENMIENGQLVGEYSQDFWKEFRDAKKLKDFSWAKDNLNFDKEKYLIARERQLNFYEAFRDTYRNQFKFKNPSSTDKEIDILVEKHIALEMKNWEDMNNNSFTYFKAKSKWANEKYVKLMQGPKEAKELYEMFISFIEYANEVMPDRVKRNFIPSFQKDYIERLSSLNLMNAIPEMMSGLLDDISMNYDDELYGKRNPITGEKIGEMWIPGTSDIKDKSLDLPVVFFKFMEGIYRFQELSTVEEAVLAIQRVVKDRNYVKVDRLGRIVPDQKAPAAPKTAANNASMLQSYIDSTFYGVKRKDDVGFEIEGNGFTQFFGILKKGDKRKISVSKIVDKMISYTTLRNLGFNLYSPIVNLLGGSANYWITGANGVYYSNTDFTKAMSLVLSQRFTPEGEKIKLILEWLQADTGEFIKEKTTELTTRKGAHLIEQYGPLSLMRESENVMKNVGAIAMLLSGKYGYTLEDFNVVDGKLEINTDIMSKEKFRQKVIRVNMKNLGGINPDDMMMAKQYIVGRMLMQHRSWLPSLFFDRFGRKRFDYILEQDIEGRYLTAFRLFKYYFNRSKYQELNDYEKANMKSAAMEAALLMGTGLLLFLLKAGLDDDDKKETWAKITTKVSSRAFSELLFFVDPTFESQYAILLNPAPVFGTTSDYAKFLGSMFNTEEDKRKKGPLERGLKLIPGINKTTSFLQDLGVIDFKEK